jgi:hypothetical protein
MILYLVARLCSGYGKLYDECIISVDVSSSDICDEDWDKRDDAKFILVQAPRGVIALRPVLLYCCYEF